MIGETWTTLAGIAGIAAVVSLGAALTYLVLTWYQDHEERTRPQRRLVPVEETNEVSRRRWSVVGLGVTLMAILVVVVLAMLGA